ncbi:MAG: putative cation transporter [Clostridiaceae bacterium]|jgi:predicted cation transporter|nr:putative cation transporter [Clostridiaceae bacterium]
MIYVLILLLAITFILPIVSMKVEKNLELFVFSVGLLASIISGSLNEELISRIFQNKFMYIIVLAVLAGGFLFRTLTPHIKETLTHILKHIPLRIFVFLLIVTLGILSSIITAIISALLLVEVINILPISRENKINIDIVSCFAIGLGAVLTPIGEPLSTMVVSKLDVSFWYLLKQFGIYIIPGILILGIIGACFANEDKTEEINSEEVVIEETNTVIIIRALKIFLFLIALDLLGVGFTPIIDNYVISLDIRYLYWINMSSAVLDNATLAVAEISSKMSQAQVKAVLMGLLISGGMMIPGNIPNIISAGKLKIKSKEWIKLGVPLGFTIMTVYYIVL